MLLLEGEAPMDHQMRNVTMEIFFETIFLLKFTYLKSRVKIWLLVPMGLFSRQTYGSRQIQTFFCKRRNCHKIDHREH